MRQNPVSLSAPGPARARPHAFDSYPTRAASPLRRDGPVFTSCPRRCRGGAEFRRRHGQHHRHHDLPGHRQGNRLQGAAPPAAHAGRQLADRGLLGIEPARLFRPEDGQGTASRARHLGPLPARLLARPQAVRHHVAASRPRRCVRRPDDAVERPPACAQDAVPPRLRRRQPLRLRHAAGLQRSHGDQPGDDAAGVVPARRRHAGRHPDVARQPLPDGRLHGCRPCRDHRLARTEDGEDDSGRNGHPQPAAAR